ncbi:FKBP-type peptidyl-prolyl cis-trans isomerase [Ekhidna sp.]|uniref:FKBP-type peptidyl-prolyl cis-trans isomerase n=1 Tax=Ekhidna sp. TaxID=2608089 RepID=UPI0032EC1CF9
MKKSTLFLFVVSSLIISGCGKDDVTMPSFEEQLAIDVKIIEDYLDDNNIATQKDESGIHFVHTEDGVGEMPEVGDFISLKIVGTILDGPVHIQDTIGFTLELVNPIIEALLITIPKMKEKGKMTVYAPSVYCFGSMQSGNVPPNSNFIFEIELLSIIKNEEDQLVVDESIIDEYLLEKNIEAEVHPSGIRYAVEEEGSGSSPTSQDDVQVKYIGRLLNDYVFDSNEIGVVFSLPNLIEAWQIMIPEMKEGGKIIIYSPSKYCYGTEGTQTIPPNAILVFEIELISIR